MGITIKVHEFRLADVEDPELYAAQPLWEWQQTDAGAWVMENAIDTPSWHLTTSVDTCSYLVYVTAKFTEKDAMFYKLKWQV